MTRAATFGWVNWSWWGESFPLDLYAANLNVLRSDVAQFFQPSIDCIVEAVLEQKNSAHKTISVSLYSSIFKFVPNPSSVFSACCTRGRVCRERLVVLQSIWIIYSPWTKHRSSWKPRVSVLQDQNNIDTTQKKNCSETKLFRMARSHSTSTTSSGLAFPKSHMAFLSLPNTTQVTQTIDHVLTTWILLLLGFAKSEIFSVLSYPKWAF